MTVSGTGNAPARSSAASDEASAAVKLPLICAGTAGDRFADDGRAQHLAVEQDGKGLAHMNARNVGELLGADGVQPEGHDRLSRALVEGQRRIDEPVALQHRLRLDRIVGVALGRRGDDHARRQRAAAQRRRIEPGDHEMKRHLRRRAQELLHVGGVLDAGKLHEDAVGAEALDRRLDDADFVDPALDDREALLHRAVHACVEGGRSRAEVELGLRLPGDLDIRLRCAEAMAGHGRDEPAQDFLDRRAPPLVGKPDDDRAIGHPDTDTGDCRLQQGGSRVVGDHAELLARHRRRIDLEHEMGSALEIEAERDLRRGQPARQKVQLIAGEEIGRCDKAADEDHERIARELPA